MSDFAGQIAVMSVAERHYGLPVLLIEEFFRSLPITPVPGADRRIAGLINQRGVSATVIDLRAVFDLPPRRVDEPSCMVLLETQERLMREAVDANMTAFAEPVVLLVDAVERIVSIRDAVSHPPAAHTGHAFAVSVYDLPEGYITVLSVMAIITDILSMTDSTSEAHRSA